MRQLEKSLLQALNDAKGKILDDDSVIATLETLKKEADDIGQKVYETGVYLLPAYGFDLQLTFLYCCFQVEETDKVIAEIETVSQQYLPLSQVKIQSIINCVIYYCNARFYSKKLFVLLQFRVKLLSFFYKQACSSIYFTMESLNQVHFLYQYSLKMFLDIFSSVLVSSGLSAVTDYTARLGIITEELFTVSTLQFNK